MHASMSMNKKVKYPTIMEMSRGEKRSVQKEIKRKKVGEERRKRGGREGRRDILSVHASVYR